LCRKLYSFIPTIFCNGQSEYDVNCIEILDLVNGATTLEEAVSRVCKVLPNGCAADIPGFVGDHVCDATETYNNAVCLYDGGDCCPQSCLARAENAAQAALCGTVPYDCIDPLYNSKVESLESSEAV